MVFPRGALGTCRSRTVGRRYARNSPSCTFFTLKGRGTSVKWTLVCLSKSSAGSQSPKTWNMDIPSAFSPASDSPFSKEVLPLGHRYIFINPCHPSPVLAGTLPCPACLSLLTIPFKMCATSRTCSTMTTPTTRRTTSIALAERVALARPALPSPFSPLTVRISHLLFVALANTLPDAKQARDLVNVLQEAKQQIDPRLAEMARYSGGGGGGGRYGGGYRGRGGGRGGRRY
ncbi:hypothetical protein QBC39DRAFT_171156 [Podospora conica]|nr:hypothetical protein QBC39DRAFT_171156 [Schizothecium conicum]